MHRPRPLVLRSGALALTATVLAFLGQAPASATTPTPSTSASHSPAPRAVVPGGIGLRVTATDGTPVSGAAFTLTDLAGTTSATAITGPDGILAFPELPAGVYHLRQTATGSATVQPAPDRDVVVPDGVTVPVTVTDPFTPASLTVHLTDRAHQPVPGAAIAITSSTGKAFTLTTGPSGSAQASLPVTARTGTTYTVTERSGPHGAPAHSKPIIVRAEPAGLIAITLTDTTTPPTTPPATTPTTGPTTPASTDPAAAPVSGGRPTTRPSASAAGPSPSTSSTPTASAPRAQLAHTGADGTTWLAGTAGLLMIIGAGALSGVRYRRSHDKPGKENGIVRLSPNDPETAP
ncbi:MSCRAMM family protein [Actinacidiphila rubida]|uniref:Carboxypeptidase regulatory-like domain-containing protein n=1 Tax=Actinacidiphila rubida TaxID=310780 RepID=A0A1H8S737_9ACTN|nr:carboxypeptidase-like regulatory domain-containing protein [Actinacidiphila rubida]SEO73963.1 Carboxypeptidase regulatory-like domain-containing protein [Actinacidiphila rubida]